MSQHDPIKSTQHHLPVVDTPAVAKADSDKAAWGPAGALIVAVVLFLVAQIAGALIVSIYPRLRGWTHAQQSDWLLNSVIGQFWYVVASEVITLAGILFYVRYRKGTLRQLGLIKPKWIDFGYAAAGFAVYVVGLEVAINVIVKQFFPSINIDQHQDVGFSSVTSHQQYILAFISLVVLPPIVEEIVFRGFLFGGLKKALPVVWAGVLTSLIFAAPHLLEGDNGKILWIAGIDTFILSLVLVYIRQKSGRLYAGMLLHATKNFVAFSALYHATIFIR